MEKYYTYVLYSKTHEKIYIGYSSDIDSRIKSHNELSNKGYTFKFRPWELIHLEEFSTKADAMKREKQLKSANGRMFIWDMISKLK
ncbi:MAG: endonuclease [Bacteroidetes bacterium B1(2017)]|nr:MAG: endonuclease [Bacteroidetes bacterium B1(2017)]